MKKLIIFSLLMNFLYASYNTKENLGKIDMHGGKGEKLINETNSLSNKDINQIGITKPLLPKVPQNLIKKDETKKDKIK